MPQRKMPGQPSGVRYAVLMSLFAGATLAYETAPLLGLDLVEDHTAEMIESIKAHMSINFMEAALLQAVVPVGGGDDDGDRGSGDEATRVDTVVFPSYSLTDVDGVVHKCTVREEPEKATSSGKQSTDTNTDISTALDPLEGSCATLSHGYWSYKWCHRKEIVQFHNDDASTTVISLGKHTRTEVKRASVTPTKADSADSTDEAGALASDSSAANRGTGADTKKEAAEEMNAKFTDAMENLKFMEAMEAMGEPEKGRASWMSRVLKKKSKGGSGGGHKSKSDGAFHGINDFSELAAVFDFYEGGDTCDETGGSRSVKTAITCCATDLVAADGHTTSPMAILVSIQEVSVCSYLVQVCSRLLCPAVTDKVTHGRGDGTAVSSGVAVTTVGHRVGGVVGILQELEACFPPKKDSWWSYKLCFSTGMSQYHGDDLTKADGTRVTKVTDEFSLGKWDRSTVIGDGEDLIHPREEGAEGEGGTIVLEFTGGTECDLTGILRSTTVHLKCGTLQEVRDVIEDRTCHYRVLAFSPLLCSHAALMPIKAAVRTVDCVAEGKKGKITREMSMRKRTRGA